MGEVQTMSKIVNNVILFNDFQLMISKSNSKSINTICLYSPKGKGKTTVINYFHDYCLGNNITCALIDFDESYESFKTLEYFFDNIILNLETSAETSIQFPNYDKEIEKMYDAQANSEVVLEKIMMVNTTIGSVFVQQNTENQKLHFNQKVTQAFLKDLKDLKKKVVIFIDHFETASEEIKNIIIKYFLKKDLLKPNIFLVVATEENIFSKTQFNKFKHIKFARLPDEYKYDDWKKYCEEIFVDETLLQPIFDSYKDDPMCMRIALKPHEGSAKNGK